MTVVFVFLFLKTFRHKQNTDAALLPTISWPCFATHDEVLYNRTKNKIVRRLKVNDVEL